MLNERSNGVNGQRMFATAHLPRLRLGFCGAGRAGTEATGAVGRAGVHTRRVALGTRSPVRRAIQRGAGVKEGG
jgi:hypothetical protein